MKTLLLARPDHSSYLYIGLKNDMNIKVNYHTFSAVKKHSWINKWKPSIKTVDSEVKISYGFTFFHRLLYELQKKVKFDYYGTENQISEYFFDRIIQSYNEPFDIVHYWPNYCYQSIKTFKNQHPKTSFIADVYAAHPQYIKTLLEPEFDKHGLSVDKSYFISANKRDNESLKEVENMLVPSNYMAKMYQEYYPSTKIFTASFGLFNPQETKLNVNINSVTSMFKVVFIGKISIEKGCTYLFEAIEKLKNANVHLDVIGEIENSQRAVFTKYFMVSNIKFLGKLPNGNVQKILPNYHTFVLPSLSDAYSIAVSEALANKVPVIVTENVGNKDDVFAFQMGEICKVKSVDSLIECILKLKKDTYRQYLISNISSFIQECQANSYSNKVLQVYKTILKTTD